MFGFALRLRGEDNSMSYLVARLASSKRCSPMPESSPNPVILTKEERRELESRARKDASPYHDVIRAKIILLPAQDLSNDVIASRLGTSRTIVNKWLKRFCLAPFAGLGTRGETLPVFLT